MNTGKTDVAFVPRAQGFIDCPNRLRQIDCGNADAEHVDAPNDWFARTHAAQRNRRENPEEALRNKNGGWSTTDVRSSRRSIITAHAHRTRHAVSRGARSC